MVNLLEEWKKECYVFSSPLNIRPFSLDRSDVDNIFQILFDYFGLEYFNQKGVDINNVSNLSHIHSLLVNSNNPATFPILFETANILLYLKKQPLSIQNKVKNTLPNDPRQFRDLLFEVYILRLFEYNKIEIKKKVIDNNNQELDGMCTINGVEFLIECKKEYVPNINLMQTLIYLSEILHLNISKVNKGFGLIGTIKFKSKNDKNNQKVFSEKIGKLFNRLSAEKFISIDYHEIDESGELHVVDYSKESNLNLELNSQNFHIIFKIIPPENIVENVANRYRVNLKLNFQVSDFEFERKIKQSLDKKKLQHLKSNYKNKIYFIDSESLLDLNSPMEFPEKILTESFFNQLLQGFDENEIICFVIRNYRSLKPEIKIIAIGKNIDSEIKYKLENLKTNYDFFINDN